MAENQTNQTIIHFDTKHLAYLKKKEEDIFMGSWNATDMITQLPIFRKDKVRLFVLSENKYYCCNENTPGYCEKDDVWEPIGYVSGNYNDYGSITNIEKDFNCTFY